MMSSVVVRKSISIFLDARPHRRHHHPPPPPPSPPADLIQGRGVSVIQGRVSGHPMTGVIQTPPPGVGTI